LIKVS